MAAGCVILASDSDPVRDFLIDGETGILVPPYDLDAWERRALAALQDLAAVRPLGDAAAARAHGQLAQDDTIPRLGALFEQLVSERR